MKTYRLTILVLVIALALFIALPNLSWAEDGAALYKGKCGACHGADGAGKVGPAVKGTKLSEAQLAEFIVKGNADKKVPHKAGVKGLTEEQAKLVAKAVKDLK
jgi:mono/diheme cytochrome c family protein